MRFQSRHSFIPPALVLFAATGVASAAAGQVQGPPIHGVTGTIAPQPSVDRFYSGLSTAVEKAGDGIDHLTRGTNPTKPHGDNSLDDLRPGMPVAVQYVVKGIQASASETDAIAPDGVTQNEGTIASVDRHRKRIAVRFADGTTETLRHAEAASSEQRKSRAVVSYADDSGRRVVKYFKPR
jgi:hypothetical protein